MVKLNSFNHAASGTQYEYALVELRLIPANMMYYESEDFATSEISYVKKDGDVDYLFFDFDGTKNSYFVRSKSFSQPHFSKRRSVKFAVRPSPYKNEHKKERKRRRVKP